MFAWSQLNFSAILVSISAVSLTSRQTWKNVNSKRRLQRIQSAQEGKRHQKKETSSCFCLCFFCFWGEVSNSWILNDIGRNFLLGNRKKIAKCLMRTFTCNSTFPYGLQCHKNSYRTTDNDINRYLFSRMKSTFLWFFIYYRFFFGLTILIPSGIWSPYCCPATASPGHQLDTWIIVSTVRTGQCKAKL